MKALLFFAAALLAVSCASYAYNGKSYPTAEARDQAIAEAKRAQEQGAAANAQRDKAKAQAAAKLDALLAGIAPADLFDFRAWDVDKGHALLEAWTNTRDFPELGRRGQAIRDEFDYQARKAKLAALRKVRYALFAVHHDGNGREGFFGEYDFRRQCYPLVGYLPEQACPWTEPGTNPGHTCNPLSMSAEAVVEVGSVCVRIPQELARKGPRSSYFLYEIVGYEDSPEIVDRYGDRGRTRALKVKLAKYLVVLEDGTSLP